MVFYDKVEQHGSFLFYRSVELFTTEGLVNLTDAAFERIILLIGKPFAASKLLFQGIDGFHGIFVGGMERFGLSRLVYK